MARPQVKQTRRGEREQAGHAVEASRGLPAIGLEAEFVIVVDGQAATPEKVFGSPRKVVRGPLVHRTGRSYHLPTGGALYFDTGVMEIATPMIEIARGCAARGTRSLWESIGFLRTELDAWEQRSARTVSLTGFSTHYNVSFSRENRTGAPQLGVHAFAYLLTHILYAPVMLLAANRRSTGVGVRPRGNRIEITADFTPDAALMAATATLIVGIVRGVMAWSDYSLAQLAAHSIPSVRGFAPVPHSSRKGWVAKDSCFAQSPFTSDVDEDEYRLDDGSRLSLRQMAGRITRQFWPSISAIGDPLSLRLIAAIMRGRAPSLLELDDRPKAYEDVGRLCSFKGLFPVTMLARSRYERVLGNAIAGHRVKIAGAWHKPVGVRGWTHIVFRRERDGVKHVRSLDDLLMHLDAWDRSANRRALERRAPDDAPPLMNRRNGERRETASDLDARRRKGDASTQIAPDSEAETAVSGMAKAARPASAEPPLVIITRM